ncbi:MAG: hypothetical protein ACE5FW_01270 [Candidatus Aenigmatarchaeota archaeon]
MSKRDLVRRALEHGLLVSPEQLEKLDEAGLKAMLAQSAQGGKTFVEAPEKKSQITVKIRKTKAKKELTPKDFVQFYNAKYSGIKDMLLRKMRAVSINKLKGMFSDVAVIGMVKEHTPKGLVLEDSTGEVEVITKDQPGLDDVLGIRGAVREGRLFPKEFVYPDIPLDHKPARVPGVRVILSTQPDPPASADLVFTPGEAKGRAIGFKENPAWITVSKSGQKAGILAYAPGQETSVKEAVGWLRKRCLPHGRKEVPGPDNPFLIKAVPEILWVISAEAGTELYKGVRVISCGAGSCRVSLNDMATEFL